MSEPKLIEFHNRIFDITIRWNTSLMSVQGAIIIGCGAIALFAKSAAVRPVCIAAICIDLLAMLIYLLSYKPETEGNTEGEDKKTSKASKGKTEEATSDVEVEHASNKKSSVKKQEKAHVIKKQLNIPDISTKAAEKKNNKKTVQHAEELELTPTVDFTPVPVIEYSGQPAPANTAPAQPQIQMPTFGGLAEDELLGFGDEDDVEFF